MCLPEKLFKAFHRPSHARPQDIPFIQIHDTGCVRMSPVNGKFIDRQLSRAVALPVLLLFPLFQMFLHPFLLYEAEGVPAYPEKAADGTERNMEPKQSPDKPGCPDDDPCSRILQQAKIILFPLNRT